MILAPGAGRRYDMGDRVSTTFLADREETNDGCSISEWWLEPRTKGPGQHQHEEDDVFYVIEGTPSARRVSTKRTRRARPRPGELHGRAPRK